MPHWQGRKCEPRERGRVKPKHALFGLVALGARRLAASQSPRFARSTPRSTAHRSEPSSSSSRRVGTFPRHRRGSRVGRPKLRGDREQVNVQISDGFERCEHAGFCTRVQAFTTCLSDASGICAGEGRDSKKLETGSGRCATWDASPPTTPGCGGMMGSDHGRCVWARTIDVDPIVQPPRGGGAPNGAHPLGPQ